MTNIVEKKLDFVGFGALNVDVFCSLKPGAKANQVVPGLRSGGEIMGVESDREQILNFIQEYTTISGRSGGGQAANTTVAMERMGFRCGYLGKVGSDEMGDLLLESLGNIDKGHIQRGEGSGMCLCILDEERDRANAVFPGCNDTISINSEDVDYVNGSKAIHITSFCSEEVLKLQEWLLHQDLADVMVTFDPGEIYSRLGIDKLQKVLEHTRVLFATIEELGLMTGEKPRKAAEIILEYGTEIVVCKRSAQGSEIITNNKIINVPVAHANEVVDKTGAGDVYAAGFIAGLLMEQSLEICGRLASEAAAKSISAYGRDMYPDGNFLRSLVLQS